jgi:hypothetical protein
MGLLPDPALNSQHPGDVAGQHGRNMTMGKEMLDDLEKVQQADDSFRRGDSTRKQYREVEDAAIRKGSTKPAGSKR